jgi:hypothetical protein
MSPRGLPIYSEFETHPLDEEETKLLKPFFVIQRQDIEKAGFVDIRLMVHGLIKRLMDEGWIRLKYPRSVLDADLSDLRNCDPNNFFSGGGYISAFLKYNQFSMPGRAIVEHFLDWGECCDNRRSLSKAWSLPSCLYLSIQTLLGSEKNITRSNMVRYLGIGGGSRNSGPKFTNPQFYYSIIKTFFGGAKSIYDAVPGWGSKLLASSILGAEYIIDDNSIFKGMSEFVGCKLGNHKPNYDLVILSGHEPLRGVEALKAIDNAKKITQSILILIHRDDANVVKARFPPKRILKAQMCPNFLLKTLGCHCYFLY